MGRMWIAGCGLLLCLLLSAHSATAQRYDDHDDMMRGWNKEDHDHAMDGMMRGWDKEDHDRSMSDMMRDWDKDDLERTMSDMMRDWDKEDHARTMSDMMGSWFEDDDDSNAEDSMKKPIQSSAGVTYEQLNAAVKDVLKGVDHSRFTVQQLLYSLQQKLGLDVTADFNFVKQAAIQQSMQGAQATSYIAPKGSVADLDFGAKAEEEEDDDHDDDKEAEARKAGEHDQAEDEQEDDKEQDGDDKHDDEHDDKDEKQSDKDEQDEQDDEGEKERAEGGDDDDDDEEEEEAQKHESSASAVVEFSVVGRKAGKHRDSAEKLDATTTGAQTIQAKQVALPASEANANDFMQPWMDRKHHEDDDDDDDMMPAHFGPYHHRQRAGCFVISAVVLLLVSLAVFWVVRRTRCLAGWSCCKKQGKQDGAQPKAEDSAEVAPLLAKVQAVQLASELADPEMANGLDTKQALLKADYTPLRS